MYQKTDEKSILEVFPLFLGVLGFLLEKNRSDESMHSMNKKCVLCVTGVARAFLRQLKRLCSLGLVDQGFEETRGVFCAPVDRATFLGLPGGVTAEV